MEKLKKIIERLKSENFCLTVLALIILQAVILFPQAAKAGDDTPPVIKMKGAAWVSVDLNDTYTDAGATCTDNVDSECTVVVDSDVDTSSAGFYRVVYDATDSAGNRAERLKRLVFVANKYMFIRPVATPPAGDYTTSQSVSLSITNKDLDKIYYTTDGTIPNNASTKYTDPIMADKDVTIKAIAYNDEGRYSSVLVAAYRIKLAVPATPIVVNENNQDDEDDDDDNDKKSHKDKKTETVATTGDNTNNDNEEVIAGEETSGQVEGEESAPQTNNESQGAAETETSDTGSSSSIWWWIIGLLILLGLAFIFWKSKKKQE